MTCVDSHTAVGQLPSLRAYGIPETSHSVTVISVATLQKMAFEDDCFNGFDEISLLVGSSHPMPDRPPVTLQGREPRSSPKGELLEWMQRTGSIVGVGDGWGLSYVVRDVPAATQFQFSVSRS